MPRNIYKDKNGTRLQGATTIIGNNVAWGKGGLMWWANDQGLKGRTMREAKTDATEPGTIAHMLIDDYLNGRETDLTLYDQKHIDAAMGSFRSCKTWAGTNGFKPIATEINLVSEVHGFGGGLDIVAEVNGGLCLGDFKTGRVYASALLQLAAYDILWKEKYPDKPVSGYFLLRIPINVEVPVFQYSYYEELPKEAWRSFEMALELSKCEKVLNKLV